MQKRDVSKLCTFGQILVPRFSLKMAKIEKNKKYWKKFSHQTIQICQSQAPIPSKKDYFLDFLDIFEQKTGCGQKSKYQNQNVT